MKYPVYSVTQVNARIQGALAADPVLDHVCVRGEISNYKLAYSGHHYFSLKDAGGVLRCAFYRGKAASLRFRPQDGMQVIAFGRVGFYSQNGECQLYVEALQPDGVGDLQAAFEQRKAKLAAEGLFDEDHKKPIPRFPRRIALVTSAVGKAVWDMIEILGARWPMAEVDVIPCRVQGDEAPAELIAAIARVNRWGLDDVIITGRGGGSAEDLWCFNDEGLARAIYASEIPVISAVGHEPDVTIADYVADLRAATPTNAAELATPDQSEQYARLDHLSRRMTKAVERKQGEAHAVLDRAARSRILRDPMTWVEDRRMLLDRCQEKLTHGLSESVGHRRRDFVRLASSLDALSPLKVLGRGYAIAQGPHGIVKSAGDVCSGDALTLKVSDGEIPCVVKGE